MFHLACNSTLAKSTIRLVYGIQLTDPDDRFFDMASTIVQIKSEMSAPRAFLVDVIPILRFLPSWCPGAKFLRTAEAWRLQARAYRDELFAAGKAAFVSGYIVAHRLRTLISHDAGPWYR